MAKKLRKEKVSDQLRRAIRDCGVSCYALSKIVNIDESTLSRFLAGERGLSMKALDRLGSFLDLEVIMHGPHATNPE